MKAGLKHFWHNVLQNFNLSLTSIFNSTCQILNNLVWPIFQNFAILSPLSVSFFGMLDTTESATHSLLFLVRTIRIYGSIALFLFQALSCFYVWNPSSFQPGLRPCRYDVLFYLTRNIYTNQKTIWILIKIRNY